MCIEFQNLSSISYKVIAGKANMTIASYFDFVNHPGQLMAGTDYMQMDLGFSFKNSLDRETPLARMFAPLHEKRKIDSERFFKGSRNLIYIMWLKKI